MEHRRVLRVHLDAFHAGELLDARLHLYGLRGFVAEALDEGFGVGKHLLLVVIGALLLLAALTAELNILVVRNFVIIDVPEFDLERAPGCVVNEGAIVRNEQDGVRRRCDEAFEPLYGLNVEVVCRFVEQEDVWAPEEQFGQLNAHAPSSAELRRRPFKVFAREAQPDQGSLQLSLVARSPHEPQAVSQVSHAFDEGLEGITFVVRARGEFAVDAIDFGLRLVDVGEGLLGLFADGACVLELHLLG